MLLVWWGLFGCGLFSFSPVNPGLITVAFSLATCLENLTNVPAPSSFPSLTDSSVRSGKEGFTGSRPRIYLDPIPAASSVLPTSNCPQRGKPTSGEERGALLLGTAPGPPRAWAAGFQAARPRRAARASCGRSAFFRRNDSH